MPRVGKSPRSNFPPEGSEKASHGPEFARWIRKFMARAQARRKSTQQAAEPKRGVE